MDVPARRYQPLPLFKIYAVLVLWITARNGILNTRSGPGWALGDWLVNYEGGFVRRGLWGEIVLQAGRVLHVSPVNLTLLLGVLVYGAIFLLVRALLKSSSWSWWVLAVVVSPCTLAFSAVDKYAGFHKEILYFAGLGLLIWMLQRGERRGWVLALYVSATAVFTILSHEPEACYGAYYFAALAIWLGSLRRAAKIVVVPAILAVGCVYAVVTHPGNAVIAERICDSLGGQSTRLCNGWIDHYMALSKTDARQEVEQYVVMYHYYLQYAVLTLLALVPIAGGFVMLWRRGELRFDLKVVAATACFSFAASVPLFVYAIDWGRWIYMHIFSLFLLLLFVDSRRSEEVWAVREQRAPRMWVYGLLLIYATCWNMPYVGNRHDGVAGRLIQAVHHHLEAYRRG
jgi:hypothetical protein